MKKKLPLIIILVIFSSFLGCKNEGNSDDNLSTELTSDEKEIAKKEISAVGKFVIENASKLNVETAMKPYLNAPEFLVINPDGSSGGYEAMKSSNMEAFKQLSSFKQTTMKEEFRFLTRTEVLYTWFGKNELQLKSGETITNESYIGTMLFRRINNEWKIVYAHESASPAIQKAS